MADGNYLEHAHGIDSLIAGIDPDSRFHARSFQALTARRRSELYLIPSIAAVDAAPVAGVRMYP